jgi:1,2-diacylglycerol 3-alpha-glucosyltransferase
MKILHCCLAAFYIDNFGYQENILPKIHKKIGHDVYIVASTENYIDFVNIGYSQPKDYFTKEGIPLTRIPYVKWIPHIIAKKLRIYSGFEKKLFEIKPDIMFLHDCQFLSIFSVIKYARKNTVKIIVDSHTDFINSGRGWLSMNILHKIIYRLCAKSIEPYVTKFYGTLPVRESFLRDIYKINEKKISLLPFGADDTLFDWNDYSKIRHECRSRLNIKPTDILLITGGKIDPRKNIIPLLKAFKNISSEYQHVKLLVFGKPVESIKNEFHQLLIDANIIYIDWIEHSELYNYFFASDLAIFPGTHSVLWEEACGLGLPCIFHSWDGIKHLDVGGNCIFIENAEIETLVNLLHKLINNEHSFEALRSAAKKYGPDNFSYTRIAEYAIQ